jgi:hypothetical protein
MVNKLNEKIAKEYGLDFDKALDNFIEDSYNKYRKNSTFYKQSIVEINEKDYPEVSNELYGFWETNEYVWSDIDGFDGSEIHTLNRVVEKQRIISEKYWEKV